MMVASSEKDVVKITNREGRTALHIACGSDDVNVLKELSNHQHGISNLIRLTDDFGWTALHFACEKNSLNAVKFLIFHGLLDSKFWD